MKVRLGRDVVAWLQAHSDELGAFSAALTRVSADELALVRLSQPIHHPGLPHMQRFFMFGVGYCAVFEWKHAEGKIRVHTIRGRNDPLSAA